MLATVKHYVANNFEQDRLSTDVAVDERALHEIYLPAFEAAVRAGVGSVMCAYNKVNGTYACDSRQLLTETLRERFRLVRRAGPCTWERLHAPSGCVARSWPRRAGTDQLSDARVAPGARAPSSP